MLNFGLEEVFGPNVFENVIDRGGQVVSAPDLDRVLREHPSVADAVVFAVPHRTLGSEIAAAVTLNSPATELELRTFMASRVAANHVPRWIIAVDQLPQHGQFKELESSAIPGEAFDSEVLARLAQIWSLVLGVSSIGPLQNFFELGGRSQTASRMLSEVYETFPSAGEVLDAADFFDHPTLAFLAHQLSPTARVSGVNSAQRAHTAVVNPTKCRVLSLKYRRSTPIFCFPANVVDPLFYRHFAHALSAERACYVVAQGFGPPDRSSFRVEELAAAAIQAVREKQPHGPYWLVGHCLGGLTAIEVARGLLAAGEQVGPLVLVDVPTPGYPKVARRLPQYVGHGFKIAAAAVRGHSPIGLRDLAAHLRQVGDIVSRRSIAMARDQLVASTLVDPPTLHWVNKEAMFKYVPRAVPVAFWHFMAAQQPVESEVLEDPRFGWRDCKWRQIEERWVPGEHISVMDEARAPALAAQIEEVFVRAS